MPLVVNVFTMGEQRLGAKMVKIILPNKKT